MKVAILRTSTKLGGVKRAKQVMFINIHIVDFSMIIISRHQERKEDYLLIGKKRVSGSKLGMPRDQDRRQDRGLDPLVVVRVDAHVLLLRRERELTNVKSLGGSVGQVGLQGAANLLIGLIDVGKCGGP